jgi:hypothetical protein
VRLDERPTASVQPLPNLRSLGPRLGSKLPEVHDALARGDVQVLDDGSLPVIGEELGADEVNRGERVAVAGWAMTESDVLAREITVADELDEPVIAKT